MIDSLLPRRLTEPVPEGQVLTLRTTEHYIHNFRFRLMPNGVSREESAPLSAVPWHSNEGGDLCAQTTKCGDEVENGKPAPDCFRATALKMGVAPEQCLVIEDAPTGVQAATAAGMRVVVVPSLRDLDAYPKPDPGCTSGAFTAETSCPRSSAILFSVLHVPTLHMLHTLGMRATCH